MSTIILKPITNANRSIEFVGSFYDTEIKQRVHLLDGFMVVVGRDLKKEERAFTIVFNANVIHHEIIYGNNKDEKDNDAEKRWIMYLKKHPLVRNEGNKNAISSPYFEIIDLEANRKDSVVRNRAMQIVANKIAAMTVQDLKDVAYFFGLNASAMTMEDIYLKLASFDFGNGRGMLMENPVESLKRLGNPDKEIIVNAQKAIYLGIIELRNGFYYVGQEQIGTNLNEVVAYFKDNKTLYEGYVYREIGLRDTLPLGSITDSIVQDALDKKNKIRVNEESEVSVKETKTINKVLGLDTIEGQKEWDGFDRELMGKKDLMDLRLEAKAIGVKQWNDVSITKLDLIHKIEETINFRKRKIKKEEAKRLSVL